MRYRSKIRSRLYVTADRHHEGVYFARTEEALFCRFYQSSYGWELWIYPWRIRRRAHTLTETLNVIDTLFKKYWEEIEE
jgi:small-conductance mechanosensitive channel